MNRPHTVIVGGSSGIGLATATYLLAMGHEVTITGRNADRLDKAKAQLGANANAMIMDATDIEVIDKAYVAVGNFDHLVLALGSSKGVGSLAEISMADIKGGFEEKVYAHIVTTKAALKYLRPGGSITFVAGLAAHAAVPGTAGIGAANAAVAALVPILAAELQPLRVNGVSPGVIDTPWWDAMPVEQRDAMFEHFAKKTPVGRVGKAADVAQAIGFLIANTYMSGHVVVCDGGLRLAA